ncbi:uncharacterized protein [Engystomops pustulosus]|uniref:uncharacterized protein isoform X2 n=1 Tax=Engystomops pustulosus TaxID=76066 RepID=UPI003AFAF9B0
MLWELKNKHRVHREKRNYAWLQICKEMEPKWESFTNQERLRIGPKAIFNHLLQTPKLKTSQAFSTLCPSFSSPGPSRPTAEEEDCTFFPVLSDSPIQEAEPLERPPRHTNRKRACTTNKMFLSLIMPPSLFSKESQEYYEKVWKHPQLKHFFNLCDRYCHQCTTLLHLQANHNNNGKVRKRCLHK